MTYRPDTLLRKVAAAICKSRTCSGIACCQWPAQAGRLDCPVAKGQYDDAGKAALDAIRDHQDWTLQLLSEAER
jgi:hypothetical protein